jgi:hypothetical protein
LPDKEKCVPIHFFKNLTMKNLMLLFVCISLCYSSRAQNSIEDELAQYSGLMMDLDGSLQQINDKIKQIKKKADAQFTNQQAIIDLEQRYLNEEREILEARREDKMRLDQLIYHIADKEKWLKEQSLLDLKQLQLSQKIVDFETRIMQIEQHVKTNYVEKLNLLNPSHSANITAYIEALNNIAFD